MIAIDTNVLLRYLLADDAGQYRRAKKLIERKAPALITDVVLAETVWTLMGKRFGFGKMQISLVMILEYNFTDFHTFLLMMDLGFWEKIIKEPLVL